MRADETARLRHFAQEPVENCPCLSIVERVYPDEHGIDLKKLGEKLVGECFVEHGRLRCKADGCKFFENPVEAVVLRRGSAPSFPVAAPDDRDPWG